MSTMLMGLCWPLQMSPTIKAVLVSLADQANDQGYCWPSVATLAERTCLSERAVRNSVRALEAMGVLRTDVGAMKSNRYVLRVREYIAGLERAKVEAGRAPEAAPSPAQAAADNAHLGGSVVNSPRHHVPPGTTCPPAPRAGEGGTTCPLTIIEPNTNTPHTPQPGPGGRLAPSVEVLPDGSGSASSATAGGRRRVRESGGAVELGTWLQRCAAGGEKPIPANDAVFGYAETVGISEALLRLCWREFKRRNEAGHKRQADWRRKFRNCVEGNWFGLWYLPPGEPARLSSKGEQAQRFWAAHDEQQQQGDGQGQDAEKDRRQA